MTASMTALGAGPSRHESVKNFLAIILPMLPAETHGTVVAIVNHAYQCGRCDGTEEAGTRILAAFDEGRTKFGRTQ